jgi:hypothetical protein
MFHVLADIGRFAGGDLLTSDSSHPLQVASLILKKESRKAVLLANLTGGLQRVQVHGSGSSVRLTLLDESNAEEAMAEPEAFRKKEGQAVQMEQGLVPVELKPYALARLDWTD